MSREDKEVEEKEEETPEGSTNHQDVKIILEILGRYPPIINSKSKVEGNGGGMSPYIVDILQ